jgi:Uma2 family endonuclease
LKLDEFVALPEDNTLRYELQEGVLVTSPLAPRKHQLAAQRLARQVDDELPAEWEIVRDMEAVVRSDDPAIVRVPDLVVTRVGGPETRLAAIDVLLAVEVISPVSRNVDTRLKPFEYAEAGIPHYWLVDLDPPAPSITVFHLASRDFGYVESPAVVGELVTSAPLPLRIDIPALVAERSTH